MSQIHTLSEEGLSYSAIAREVGIHRVTVRRWLQRESSLSEAMEPSLLEGVIKQIPPPMPWTNWDEVKQVREVLQEHRFLMLRRSENLDVEEREQVAFLLNSPAGLS